MRWPLEVSVLVASLIAPGCGGGPDTSRTGSPASTASEPAAATSAAALDRCPLTPEQVSVAVGAPVQRPDSSICRFEPVDRKAIRPTVLLVRQFSAACSGTVPAEGGYKEQVPGLDVTTYIADDAEGVRILVCNGTTPFEIVVDAEPLQVRRDAAVALARQVLAGS